MLLSCRNISKSFQGVDALQNVDFDVAAGEVHGLVGANGAGKSTLMRILSGALGDHVGSIEFEGKAVQLSNPHDALAAGIAMVYQELSGIGSLSVTENLFLGRQLKGKSGLLSWSEMRRQGAEILEQVGLGADQVDVKRRLDHYSLGVRQLIEIARCLSVGSRLLILDEPTSALSPPERQRLFGLIRQLRESGRSIIFISHFIEDVLEICDRVTVLAGGRLQKTLPCAGLSKHEVIHLMLGGADAEARSELERSMETGAILPPHPATDPLLRGRDLTRKNCFDGINLAIHPGETLGIYGFAGAGHLEVAHALAGSIRLDAGEIQWEGCPISLRAPANAVKLGIAFVAADRASTLIAKSEIYKNLTLARLREAVGNWISSRRELALAGPALERVGCRPANPRLMAGALSGGNQQKVVIAKWLLGPVRLLVLEEPTRGMDVGAKTEVMEIVRQLKSSGTAVLLASSEPELLLAHADRIIVMRRGKISREFAGCPIDEAELLRHA